MTCTTPEPKIIVKKKYKFVVLLIQETVFLSLFSEHFNPSITELNPSVPHHKTTNIKGFPPPEIKFLHKRAINRAPPPLYDRRAVCTTRGKRSRRQEYEPPPDSPYTLESLALLTL